MGSYPDEFPFGIMEVVELLHLRVRRQQANSVYPAKYRIIDSAAAIAGAGGRLIAGSGFLCGRSSDFRYCRVGIDLMLFAGVFDLRLAFRHRGRRFFRLLRIGKVDFNLALGF